MSPEPIGASLLYTSHLVDLHCEVTQSCLTLYDPVDCSLPRFSVHGIFQARLPDWVAIAFSKSCYGESEVKVKSLGCVRLFVTRGL